LQHHPRPLERLARDEGTHILPQFHVAARPPFIHGQPAEQRLAHSTRPGGTRCTRAACADGAERGRLVNRFRSPPEESTRATSFDAPLTALEPTPRLSNGLAPAPSHTRLRTPLARSLLPGSPNSVRESPAFEASAPVAGLGNGASVVRSVTVVQPSLTLHAP